MRAFVLIRQYALSHQDLTEKLKQLEVKFNQQFDDIYQALTFLMEKEEKQIQQQNRTKIGY